MSRFAKGGLSAAMLILALGAQAMGQEAAALFSKAPPGIDEALRDRISKYFQLQVDGKPRQAEQYVAEDSKDYYYAMQKPRYLSFEIRSISYSDEFTKAKAMIAGEMNINLPEFQNKPMKIPFMTYWKVVDGQWFWYVEPDSAKVTPFGKMNPGSAKPTPSDASDLSKGPDVAALWKQVQADKKLVQLKGHEASSEQVTISSQFPGPVVLEIHAPRVAGLDVKLDRTELKTGEKATLSFDFTPGTTVPRPVVVGVSVQPINSLIRVQVLFQ